MKDSEGVDIYEGDIINIHMFYEQGSYGGVTETDKEIQNALIEKKFGSIGFQDRDGDWVAFSGLALNFQFHEESFEVLGNIYENHELLEVAE